MKDDIHYMNLALKEAEKSILRDEVPVGAVIVKDGKVIAKGHNKREKTKDPTDHAEIVAIRKACRKIKSWRLIGCTIYVTIEPCSMCAGTILWARMAKVVYGAKDPKGGALGSSYDLFSQKGINHQLEVKNAVLEEECASLIKRYFQKKRIKDE